MGLVTNVFLVALVVCVFAAEKYTTKYDNIDIDEILSSDRLVEKYKNCIIGNGPCTKDGQVLKEHIKDALETGCSKCSDRQKCGVQKVCNHLKNNKAAWWKEILDHYDPKGEFEPKYTGFLNGAHCK